MKTYELTFGRTIILKMRKEFKDQFEADLWFLENDGATFGVEVDSIETYGDCYVDDVRDDEYIWETEEVAK